MALQHAMGMLVALVSLQVLLVELGPVAMARPGPQDLVCNMLPIDECAFAVDSRGFRCVLETLVGGVDWHVCQTSDVMVCGGNPVEYIETDQCVKACGVAKMTVGLSTDALMSQDFTSKLCSLECQDNCANLVDLYSNLASGEGNSLRMMCANHQHRRMDAEVFQPVYHEELAKEHASLIVADEPTPSPTSGA